MGGGQIVFTQILRQTIVMHNLYNSEINLDLTPYVEKRLLF